MSAPVFMEHSIALTEQRLSWAKCKPVQQTRPETPLIIYMLPLYCCPTRPGHDAL